MTEIDPKVVITGYGINCSAGENADDLFQNMMLNYSGIRAIDCFDTGDLPSNKAGTLASYRKRYQSVERKYDYSTLFAIDAINQALEMSNLSADDIANKRIALCVGNANSGMEMLEQAVNNNCAAKFGQYASHQQSDNIANHFGIKGPVFTFTSACTASSSAVGFAKQLLEQDLVDIVIAGGTDALALTIYAGFHSLQSVSPSICSPYDVKTGLSLGEGAGFLILEKKSYADTRQIETIAQLVGVGSSLDAYHATSPEPKGLGVCRSFQTALNNHGVNLKNIEYVNTHGTGTPANDSAELMGICRAVGVNNELNIPVSSSKSYFGHTLGAAGAIEFISTLITIRRGYLPSTLNHEEIREDCKGFNIIVNGLKKKKVTCFASTNSAFGGHNTTLIASMEPRNTISDKSHKVFILGFGKIAQQQVSSNINGSETFSFDGRFSLKFYQKSLYRRRMSTISQYAIGSAYAAFRGCNIDKTYLTEETVGAYFGTSLGATEVQSKNLQDLILHGPSHIKSILFPDTVLNSALGNLAVAFGLKGCSANCSDLGNDGMHAIWHAYNDLFDNKLNCALVSSAEDCSSISSEVWRQYGINNTSLLIPESNSVVLGNDSNKLSKQALAEIVQLGAGRWYLCPKLKKWECPSLFTRLETNESIDVVIFSSVNTSYTDNLLEVIYQHYPTAKIIDLHSILEPSISCQSINAIIYGTELLSGTKYLHSSCSGELLDINKVLVMTVNVLLSATSCILQRPKG
ncbi:3-oxoacyl-[acyl-carrier-protein] synthase, KASII [Moritella sp. JT01]|uniref:beta-ketoacyl-[acyl-carrier-protein] synthase family protein n=1 Tax=Moritella sp. JT01 TaxID=756698 RepID=UPI00079BCF7D|nr:beta-ketoacyl-[acyl-carrier-protein] synthase family protein [Moritella sp. JT01]KXO12884.1 3-oxoacyl-[acyl-carrier-protein] synthase, KASII [Moritella sp. JT01]